MPVEAVIMQELSVELAWAKGIIPGEFRFGLGEKHPGPLLVAAARRSFGARRGGAAVTHMAPD
jgi:hypothetical protein